MSDEIIKIFPWSRSSDIDDKLFYEQNVSNLIRQVVDNNFVISGNIQSYKISDEEPLRVNIYGYYIEINKSYEIPHGSKSNVYIKINLSTDSELPELIQGSEGPISFVGSIDNTRPHLYLHICNEEGNIPDSSRIKFKKESLDLLEIDGQHAI